jgi:hypothetical protein
VRPCTCHLHHLENGMPQTTARAQCKHQHTLAGQHASPKLMPGIKPVRKAVGMNPHHHDIPSIL